MKIKDKRLCNVFFAFSGMSEKITVDGEEFQEGSIDTNEPQLLPVGKHHVTVEGSSVTVTVNGVTAYNGSNKSCDVVFDGVVSITSIE